MYFLFWIFVTALLTRCYTQHALRPYIDSEMNHIRHFIKIPFINKGIDFIDLPSIFRDNTVESSILNYFENKEPPIICYKYNKPIRSTIFNFNKLVANLELILRLQIHEIVKLQNSVMNQEAILLQEI